jgi:glycosyltransferase involved in cell wall biosynthesis
MAKPLIEFIIATYKRYDALRCTLESLLLQDYTNWRAIVVGDCCEETTAKTIKRIGDPRISYYNLPVRYGEQSGPNTFGLELVQGEYVCFLNHDDLLLNDHISKAINQMILEQSDFHISLAANATRIDQKGAEVIPVFTHTLPLYLELNTLLLHNHYLFDPSSFWLTRTTYAKSCGPWSPSTEIWRTPLRDWLLRAWKMGGRFSFGSEITGLRFLTGNFLHSDKTYSSASPEIEYIVKRLQSESSDIIRKWILNQYSTERKTLDGYYAHFKRQLMYFYRVVILKYPLKFLASLYFSNGLDVLDRFSQLSGKPKGGLHKRLIKSRTGESFDVLPDLSEVLKNPETYRIL